MVLIVFIEKVLSENEKIHISNSLRLHFLYISDLNFVLNRWPIFFKELSTSYLHLF